MSLLQFAKIVCLAMTFSICPPGNSGTALSQEAMTLAKADTKSTPKTVKKNSPGKKATAKPKVKPKSKSLKAKTAPPPKAVKTVKAAKKIAPVVTKTPSAPIDWGFWFLVAVGFTVVATVVLTIWYEYRPTVNASGTVYGPHEYLPAHQGGAFTSEFHGNSSKHPLRVDPGTAFPTTVTREPLHADSRSTTKPSTVALTASDVAPVKKAQ